MVGACSLATGLAIALVISMVEIATDVAIYGFSAGVVIPIGAVGCGLVAALGFYAASRAFQVRPAGLVLGIPLVTAVATFLAAHWLSFNRHELLTGETFAEVMALEGLGFADYLRLVATESGVTLGASADTMTIGRLGSWGYGVVAIEILGFALGGWFVATVLRRKPWCEVSGRFLSPHGKSVRYFDDPDQFEAVANHLVDVLERGGPEAAFEHAAADKSALKRKRNAQFGVSTTRFVCNECGVHHTVISTQHQVNNNWTQLSQTPLHPGAPLVGEQTAQLIS